MLLTNGRYIYHGTPKNLPCGVEINQDCRDKCCRTVCPDKSDAEIDDCHRTNKRKNRRPEFEPPKEMDYETAYADSQRN
jgi:hypothetical protein